MKDLLVTKICYLPVSDEVRGLGLPWHSLTREEKRLHKSGGGRRGGGAMMG